MNFTQMNLIPQLVEAVEKNGYTKPTPIQEATIPLLLKEKDVYGWELPKMIEQKYGFKPGKITPYRVLYRLEEDAFVQSKADQRRRVYKITDKGSEELKKAKEFYQFILNELNK